jgi:uncharacterized protein (TIGR01370 family)
MAHVTHCLVAAAMALAGGGQARGAPSIAVHYGDHPPLSALRSFDRVVLEPDHVSDQEVADLREAGATVFAYLSVGEAHQSRPYFARLPARWSLGRHTVWGGLVMDPASDGWRDLLTEEALTLRRRGFSGLFLDTVDSYEDVITGGPERARRVSALLGWLRSLKTHWPDGKVILNRGFALFPAAATLVDGLLVESLFASYDAEHDRYREVPESDRRWLLDRLEPLRASGLPITVVDYLPPGERERARELARRIAGLGFVPWVAPGRLDRMGVGAVEAVPRRVLMVYDGRRGPMRQSPAHRLMAMPIEYLGFAIDYMDAAAPREGHLGDEYAGIVAWLTDEDLPESGPYRAWLGRQLAEHVPLAIVGRFGCHPDTALLQLMGLVPAGQGATPPVRIGRRDPLLDYEAPVVPLGRDVPLVRAAAASDTVHLELADAGGALFDPVVTGPWGGLALYPYVLADGPGDLQRWVLDPFTFLTRALHLVPAPVLDATTENGRRLMTVHVDGDGFLNVAEHPGLPLSAKLLLDDVLRPRGLPTTVSVIEGEVGPTGMYPEQSPALEAVAREIFRLPQVEIASHTYSHPFDWEAAETGTKARRHTMSHMPIPGYTFDLRREIVGSVTYIDQRLAPPDKRTRLFLWSGSAEPDLDALALTHQLGLLNVNGASSRVDGPATPSLTEVTALARPVGRYLQVYAQAQNENTYTNLWHGPYYGFRRVIQAFQRSDLPRRLKPISLYYHFYAVSKAGGLTALHQVYDWAAGEEVFPLYLSEFAERVEDFYRATLARTLDGGWRWKGLRSLRTFRVPEALGWPDLEASPDLASVRELPQGRYATLLPGDGAEVRFRAQAPDQPHLEWSNARVLTARHSGRELTLHFKGHVPVRAAVAGCGRARVTAAGNLVSTNQHEGRTIIALSTRESRVVVSCN